MVDKYPAVRAHLQDLTEIDKRWFSCLELRRHQPKSHESVDYQQITDIARELGIEGQWHNESMDASFEARQMLNDLSQACRKRSKSPPSLNNQTTLDDDMDGLGTSYRLAADYHTFGRQQIASKPTTMEHPGQQKKSIVKKLHLSFEEPSAILETTEHDYGNSTIVLVDEEAKQPIQDLGVAEASFFNDNLKDQSIAQFSQLYKDLGIQEDHHTRKLADFLYEKNRAYFERGTDDDIDPVIIEEDKLGTKPALSRVTDEEAKLQELLAQKRPFKFGYELEKFNSEIISMLRDMELENEALTRHNQALDLCNSLIEDAIGEESIENGSQIKLQQKNNDDKSGYTELLRKFSFKPRSQYSVRSKSPACREAVGTKRNILLVNIPKKIKSKVTDKQSRDNSVENLTMTKDRTSGDLQNTISQSLSKENPSENPAPFSLLAPALSSILSLTDQAESRKRLLSASIFSHPQLSKPTLVSKIFSKPSKNHSYDPAVFLQSYLAARPLPSNRPLTAMQASICRLKQSTDLFPVVSSPAVVGERNQSRIECNKEYQLRNIKRFVIEYLDV